jgi:hypothetical protein
LLGSVKKANTCSGGLAIRIVRCADGISHLGFHPR